jgi:hypothetical protein
MMRLITPPEYDNAHRHTRNRICNGTGAVGTPAWLVRVLDSFNGWGIDFREASNVHDWMYHWGCHWYHKIRADIVFFVNMLLICIYAIFQLPISTAIGNLMMFPIRLIRAIIYFLAVFFFGWSAFFKY